MRTVYGIFLSHPCQHMVLSNFLTFANMMAKMTSCSLTIHVTDYYKEKHILMSLANQVSLPLNYFTAAFTYSKGEGFFFLLICRNSLCILYTHTQNVLCGICTVLYHCRDLCYSSGSYTYHFTMVKKVNNILVLLSKLRSSTGICTWDKCRNK